MSEELVSRMVHYADAMQGTVYETGTDSRKIDGPAGKLLREAAAAIEQLTRENDARHATILAMCKRQIGDKADIERLTRSRDGYAKDSTARAAECDRLSAELAKAREALEQIEDLPGYAPMQTVQAIAHAALAKPGPQP
jgi:hypothetical protein